MKVTELKALAFELLLATEDRLEAAFEAAERLAREACRRADERYQEFIAKRVDSVLGGTRAEQLTALPVRGKTEQTDEERELNRCTGTALLGLTTAVTGVLVFPPALLVSVAAMLYSTRLVFENGFRAAFRERRLNMDGLGCVFLAGAVAGGYFVAAGFSLFAYYLSSKLVFVTQDRSKKSLIDVFGDHPRVAWLLVNGVELEVALESVQEGDLVAIQAGQVVPIDGVITSGFATVDQHKLTGEGQPAELTVGDFVFAGTLTVAGKAYVKALKTGEQTAAAQVGEILNKTASFQAAVVSEADRFADGSATPTLLLALIAFPLVGYRYAVTIAGSAIGLNARITAPVAVLNFLRVAAQQGILIKDGRSLETLKKVDTVVFDKTGTLSQVEPAIAEVHDCAGVGTQTILYYAAAAEHRQTHPIAQAILAEATRQGLTLPEIEPSRYEIGYGLSVRLAGRLIRAGSSRYMAMENVELPEHFYKLQEAIQKRGHSAVLIAADNCLAGVIELQPALRPEAALVIRELRSRNIDLYIASGDQEEPTRRVAETLGVRRYFANTLPENKASLVEKLQSEGRVVCLVGDGINDAIAFKKANVSISIRGASTAAIDTAGIVLMSGGLEYLPRTFELAEDFDKTMQAGFGIAVGQGVVVIAGAFLSVVGIVTGTLIWEAGLLAGLTSAILPLYNYRSDGKIRPREIKGQKRAGSGLSYRIRSEL